MKLSPDPDFATQVILPVHCQCYYYVHCLHKKISPILVQVYGWFFNCEPDFTRQVWFKEDQLP